MASWPASLPAALASGYTLEAGVNTVRTDMDSGSPRVRRRSTSAADLVTLAWLMTPAQMMTFRAFWATDLYSGAAWIVMPVKDGRDTGPIAREVRFVAPFKADYAAGNWQVSAQVEVRIVPPSVAELCNALGLPSLALDFVTARSLASQTTSLAQPSVALTLTRSSTARYFDAAGVLQTAAAHTPRYDYDPVTHACRGLLVEEARTNLCLYSQTLANGAWAYKNNVNMGATAAGPDGLAGFQQLVETTATGNHGIGQPLTASAGQSYVCSLNFKAGGRTKARLAMEWSGAHGITVDIDLSAGTIGTAATYGGTPPTVVGAWIFALGGGVYRVAVAGSHASSTALAVFAYLRDATGQAIYTGDSSKSLYAGYGQVEAGTFPTSYVPTTTAAVTRAADVAEMTGTAFGAWYNAAGTLIAARMSPAYAAASVYDAVALYDGTGNNQISVRTGLSGSQYADVLIAAAGVTGADTSNVSVAGLATATTALAFDADGLRVSVNGGAVETDAAIVVPAVDQLRLGGSGAGWFRSLTFYPKKFAGADLPALSA